MSGTFGCVIHLRQNITTPELFGTTSCNVQASMHPAGRYEVKQGCYNTSIKEICDFDHLYHD